MAIISHFCFACSVRLGSIIIGFCTLIQSTIFLIAILVAWSWPQAVTEALDTWFNTINLEGKFYKDMANNPKTLMSSLVGFFTSLLSSCILLIFGSYQCKPKFLYPFVILYLCYLIGLLVGLMVLLKFVKVKGNGLGDLILYSNIGGFALLFYFYTWICVVSTIQIINELRERLSQKLKAVENVRLSKQKIKPTKHHKKNKRFPIIIN